MKESNEHSLLPDQESECEEESQFSQTSVPENTDPLAPSQTSNQDDPSDNWKHLGLKPPDISGALQVISEILEELVQKQLKERL